VSKNVTAGEGYEEKRTQEINQENNKERKKKSSRENYTFHGMRSLTDFFFFTI